MSTISAVADDAAIGYELDIHEQSESFGLIRRRLAVQKFYLKLAEDAFMHHLYLW